MPTPFWVSFEDNAKGVCVEAIERTEAIRIAEEMTGRKCSRSDELPYPAHPRIGPKSSTPTFCYATKACFGRHSCPRDHACND